MPVARAAGRGEAVAREMVRGATGGHQSYARIQLRMDSTCPRLVLKSELTDGASSRTLRGRPHIEAHRFRKITLHS